MALGITTALVGPVTPQSVQLAITGLTVGQAYLVTAQAAGTSWTVRGGDALATATQVVLTDAATPVNTEVTYRVTSGAESVAAAAVTVPYADGRYVLQTLDGRVAVPFRWLDNGDPRDPRTRGVAYDVPGRTTPPVRWDVMAGEDGHLRALLSSVATATLLNVLRTGAPILVVRTDGALRDLAPVETILIKRAPRTLWRGADDPTARVWDISFEVIDDPEPGTVLAVSTWDDFDAAYSEPSILRTNLNPNPSVETNTTGYTGGPASTLTRVLAAGYEAAGSYCLNVAYTGAAPVGYASASQAAVTLPAGSVGRWIGFGLSVRGVSGATHFRLRITTGTTDVYSAYLPISTAAVVRSAFAAQVPVGATTATLSVVYYGSGAGASPSAGSTRVDAWSFELGDSQAVALARALDYFDGATGGGTWTSTAHASTSVRTDAPTWDDFDAEWSGLTWDQFDQVDWSTR